MLPSIGGGLFHDDLIHWAKLQKDVGLPARYYGTPHLPSDSGTAAAAMRDMFAMTRTPGEEKTLKDLGLVPWWASEQLRISNWRPLTALTHWLDYRLFPDSPSLMHVHNMAWFAVVVVLVTALYRQMMGAATVAALAAFLYAIDDSNCITAGWLANRNLLMALCFSILALMCHDQWRRRARRGYAVLAPVLLLFGLLSTEAAIATFAYLFAYALVIDRSSVRQRVLSLLPTFLVIVGWRLVYSALGHGASGGGFVIDPGREPLAFVRAILERAPLLLAGQWTPLWADTEWMLSKSALGSLLVPIHVFLVVLLLVLLPLCRRDRISLFWLIGMLLCIVPISATVPMNRNLLFVAIGAFALAARFMAGLFGRADWLPGSRLYRVPAWIVCLALVLAHIPIAMVARVWSQKMFFSLSKNAIYETVKIGDSPDLPNREVFVVNAPNPLLFVGLPQLRRYQDEPIPACVRVLAPGWRTLDVSRAGDRTLVIRSREGDLLSVAESDRDMRPNFLYMWRTFNTLWRGDGQPFQAGQRMEVAGMTIQVVSVTPEGSPQAIQLDFSLPLEDPSLRWVQWDWRPRGLGSYSPFTVPAVGETVVIPGPF